MRPKEPISDSEKFPVAIEKQQQQTIDQTAKQKKENLKRPKNSRNVPTEQIFKGSGLNRSNFSKVTGLRIPGNLSFNILLRSERFTSFEPNTKCKKRASFLYNLSCGSVGF